jgi:hypothetical protein
MNDIFYPEISDLDPKLKYLVIDSKFGVHPWRFALETYLSLFKNGFNVSYTSFVDLDIFSVVPKVRLYIRNLKYRNERHQYSKKFELKKVGISGLIKFHIQSDFIKNFKNILLNKSVALNLQTAIDSWISTHKGTTNYNNNFFTKWHSIRVARAYSTTLLRIEKIMKKNRFDVIFTFNGRFPVDSAISEYCVKNNIRLYLFDGGSISQDNYNRIQFFETSPHNNLEIRNKIETYWNLGGNQKFDLAHKSILSMIKGERFLNSRMNWENTRLKTDENLQTYISNKISVVFFSSSDWEQGAINRWRPKIGYPNQFDFFYDLGRICNEFNLKLLLKPHPIKKNVTRKNADFREYNTWAKFCKQRNLNVTILHPTSGIRTRDLLKGNFIVAGFGTSVLAQSIYLGKSTLVGCEEVWLTDENIECYVSSENDLRSRILKILENRSESDINAQLVDSVLPWAFYRSVCGMAMRYTNFSNKSLSVANIEIDKKRFLIRFK